MANLYDSPAQAQFINTYVPIQFDSLYKGAETARANIEKGEALQDELSQWRSLGSLNQSLNMAWQEKVGKPIEDYINKNIKSQYDLSNPQVIAGLRSLQRKISGSEDVKAMLESKEGYKKTMEQVDPRLKGYYMNKIQSHDISQGIWAEKPSEYVDFNAIGDAYTKDLGARKLGRSKDGFTEYWGIAEEDVKETIEENKLNILSDPSIRATAESQLMSRGISPGMPIAADGKKIQYNDYLNQYILDNVTASAMDKTKQRIEKTDDVALAQARMAQQWRMFNVKRQDAAAKDQREAELRSITTAYTNRVAANRGEMMQDVAFRNINSVLRGIAPSERDKVGIAAFGPNVYKYYKAYSDFKSAESNLQSIANRKAEAAASKDKAALKALNDEYNNANYAYKAAYSLYQSSLPSGVRSIENEYQKVADKSGKSRLFYYGQKEQIDTPIEIPSAIAESWADVNFGESSKFIDSNKNVHMLRPARNISQFVYTTPSGVGYERLSRTSTGIDKLMTGISQNKGAGVASFENTGYGMAKSDGVEIHGNLVFTKEALMNEYGLTEQEVRDIYRLPGVSKFKGVSSITGKTEVFNKDTGRYEQRAGAQEVEMIKIPVAKMGLEIGNTISNIVIDADIEKKYKTNSRLEPEDYNEEEFLQ